MINRFKPKSKFSANVLTLMTGTALSQAIPIAIMPILTRLYEPKDFGLLALFTSVTAILSSIANGRYELAIMLPETEDEAINIGALSLIIASLISTITLLIIIIFNDLIITALGNKDIKFWLYFAPFVIFMTGAFNVLNYLNTRLQLFKDISKATVYKSVGAASVQLSFGLIKSGATGLISGQMSSLIISNTKLTINVIKNYNIKAVNLLSIRSLAKRYIDFPKFSMFAILANTLSFNLTNILISTYFSVTTLGFYSFAQKLLKMPAALIGKSIGQVFFQEASKEKQATGKAINSFNNASKKLILFSILLFVPLYFLLPYIFELVFGEEWRTAGEYGVIILPLVAAQFVSAALSNIMSVFEKQRISLLWQLGLLILSIGIIIGANFYNIEFKQFLQILSLVLMTYYIFLFFIMLKVSKG